MCQALFYLLCPEWLTESLQPHKIVTVDIPISPMWKLWPREVKQLTQGHTFSSLNLRVTPGSLAVGPTAPTQPHHPAKDYTSEEANGGISSSPLICNEHSQCHEVGTWQRPCFWRTWQPCITMKKEHFCLSYCCPQPRHPGHCHRALHQVGPLTTQPFTSDHREF